MRNRGDVLTGSWKLLPEHCPSWNTYESAVSVSPSLEIGREIKGINVGLDVANEH